MGSFAMFGGVFCGLLCLLWYLSCDRDVLYAASQAITVMFGVALVLLFSMRVIARILLGFLRDQQQLPAPDKSNEQE